MTFPDCLFFRILCLFSVPNNIFLLIFNILVPFAKKVPLKLCFLMYECGSQQMNIKFKCSAIMPLTKILISKLTKMAMPAQWGMGVQTAGYGYSWVSWNVLQILATLLKYGWSGLPPISVPGAGVKVNIPSMLACIFRPFWTLRDLGRMSFWTCAH